MKMDMLLYEDFLFESLVKSTDIRNKFASGFSRKENMWFISSAIVFLSDKTTVSNLQYHKKRLKQNIKFGEKLKEKYGLFYEIIIDVYSYTYSAQYVGIFRDKYKQGFINKLFKNSIFIKLFKKHNGVLYRGLFIKNSEVNNFVYRMKEICSFSKEREAAITILDDSKTFDIKNNRPVLIIADNLKYTLDISGVSMYPEEKEVLVLKQKVSIKDKKESNVTFKLRKKKSILTELYVK